MPRCRPAVPRTTSVAAVLGLILATLGLVAAGAPASSASPAPPDPSVVAAAPAAGTFTVPLVTGVAADPSITIHGGIYHMLYNKPGYNNKIVVRTSPSLATMTTGQDHVIYDGETQNPAEIKCGTGLGSWFLPYGGKWYLFGWGDNCNGWHTARPFVAESAGSDPLGPYTHKVTFSSPSPEIGGDGHGYAASPLTIDGQLYLAQTSNNKIYLARMANPTTLATGWNLIAQAASSGWECAGRCLDEGGSVLVRGGKVFLLFSAGAYDHPDYCVGMLEASTSSNLLQQASWTKSTDCVFRSNGDASVYGPASMIHFKSPDSTEDWVVYHVKTTEVVTGGDRYLQAKRIGWTADGKPALGAPVAMGTAQQLPSGDPG